MENAELWVAPRERLCERFARLALRTSLRWNLSWTDGGMLAIPRRAIKQRCAGDTPQVVVAIAENMLHSDVKHGENAGRALEHDGVGARTYSAGKLAQVQMDFHPRCCPRGATNGTLQICAAVVFVQGTSQPPHSGRSGDSISGGVATHFHKH